MHWIPKSTPPRTTRKVVIFTNYNDVFRITFTKTAKGGDWERPDRFNDGEEIEWWTDIPSRLDESLI